jgi:hypothetical protein
MNKWEQTGWTIRAKGSRHLFSMIGAVGGYSSQSRIAWRGMSSIDYGLMSSLQRSLPDAGEEQLRLREIEMMRSAREWGLGYGAGGWSSDFQLLADLQHYGVATRLVDVTSNPMTALWFASQEVRTSDVKDGLSEDGVLLAINTEGWDRFGRSAPVPTFASVGDPTGWEMTAALDRREPFVVESLVPNDRLRAQEGYFLAGALPPQRSETPFDSFEVPFGKMNYLELEERLRMRSSSRPIEERLPFVAFRVPAELKERILQRLENSYNRHASVLFPDFAGFLNYSPTAQFRQRPAGARDAGEIGR